MKNIQLVMEQLEKDEGITIHKNTGELDITSMYGIYKHRHPKANIFKEIDNIARTFNLSKHSNNWSKADLEIINTYINTNRDRKQKFYNLALEFYNQYYKRARLELFPKDCVIAMGSMYANSKVMAWKSVQFAINTMISNKLVDHDKLICDGFYGSNTKQALLKCTEEIKKDESLALLFESYMIMGMAVNYARLVKRNSNRYLRFLIGWNNRLIRLLETR